MNLMIYVFGIVDVYPEGTEALWEALTFLGTHCEILEEGKTAFEFYTEDSG